MKFIVDPQPVYNNGKPSFEYSPDESGGSWTKLGWIRLNPDMQSVMSRYGIDSDVQEFTKMIIAHELAHEVWNNIASDELKQSILAKARQEKFMTPYLSAVNGSKLDEETFCEYLAQQIMQ